MSVPRPNRQRLAIESLEQRQALAGNVVAVFTEGTLSILGDDAANGVTIIYDVATKTHRVHGSDAGGQPTSINGELGSPLPPTFAGVKNIHVRLGLGDDRLDFGAADQVYTGLAKGKLTIEMGSGNDEVTLGKAGNDPSHTTDVLHRLYVNKGIHVDLGEGNDVLKAANLKTNKSLVVMAGDGNDNIQFVTEFTPTGQTEPILFPLQIKGNLHVHLGAGDDQATLQHSIVGQHVRVLDPQGVSIIKVCYVALNEKLEIVTGHADDDVTLDFVRADDLQLQTNAGNDDVKIDHSRFKRMNVRMGNGSDDLILRNSRTTWVTYLDGGDGGADYSQRNNSLRGLVRRRLS